MAEGRTLEIRTPKVYLPLLKPARYKGVFGGRGGGKSWFMAEMLIERHLMYPGTYSVCIREVQASLAQSVKRLLEIKIQQMGVGQHFRIQDTEIHTPGNGLIIFMGMQNHTAESIKSLESYDTAWVEEAQVLSQRSLDLLRPTIRSERISDGSEIWFSWNPRDPKDPVDQFLRGDPHDDDEDFIVVKANYYDNPWLPSVLLKEIAIDRKRDPDKFRHIWLGEYWNQGNARVFKNWTVEEFESPVGGIYRLGADWGYAEDPSVLVRSRLDGRRLYIDYEAYMVGCEIDFLPDLFDTVPGSRKFFITADSARPETIAYMQRHGFPRMVRARKGKGSIEDGIEFMKSYDIVVHPRCPNVIEELNKYSWKIDPLTNEVLPILQDKNNNCIAEGELVTCERGEVPIQYVTTNDFVLTRDGYKKVLFADVTDINRKVLCVETTVGMVKCTPDHKIYTDNGFVEAQYLSPGDGVIGAKEGLCLSVLNGAAKFIDGILMLPGRLKELISKHLGQEEPLFYTEMCGLQCSDPYLKATTSTTLTETLPITTYQISCASTQKSIPHNTLGVKSNLRDSSNILKASGNSQNLGIAQKKVKSFIEKLVVWLTKISNQSQKNAIIAEKSSYQRLPETETGFVVTHVSPHTAGQLVLTILKERAASVVKRLLLTNILTRKLVPGRVLTVTEAGVAERVYDLTVEYKHEFCCNNILLSNCIDSVRYSLEGARKAERYKGLQVMPNISYGVLDNVVGY